MLSKVTMVKSKRRATKSQTADPMTPPLSPTVDTSQPVQLPVDPPPTSETRDSNTESELPPLPKERALDQHPITSFFQKSPSTKEKEKQVVKEEAKMKQEPGVAKQMKLPIRRSVRKDKATTASAQASFLEPEKERPETVKPQKQEEVTKETISTSKKRKTEAEKLEVPEQAKPSTRQRQKVVSPTKSAPSPPTKPQPPATTADPEEPRPKIRRKQAARKKKTEDFDTKTFYPFITSHAKASFESSIRHKQPIRERTLDWEAAEDFIKDVITGLHWEQFCHKPDEGALMLIKEFYANLESMVDNKVFVRGVWVLVTSEEINKVIGAPDCEEDAYSLLMDAGITPQALASKLCVNVDKVAWTTSKNNQPLSFPTSALRPHLIPLLKFICCRLIPTTHTSHVTLDRATLLLAMIEKREVDAGWIIYNNLLESSGAGKGLWFPAIITKLCVQAGVKVEKEEEKVKAGLQIHAKASTDYVLHPVGTPHAASGIMEELKQISDALQQLTQFAARQQAWNSFMEQAWKETVSSLNLPFAAGSPPSQEMHMPKAKKVATKKNQTPAAKTRAQTSAQGKEPVISGKEDEEEEVAAHLGGGEPLTGKFTSANMSSEDEEAD